jgi:uncharacterized protein (DUF305 family)
MPPSRRVIVPAAVVLAVLGLGVLLFLQRSDDPANDASGERVVQPGAPGQSGRTLSPEELKKLSPPAHTPADTLFMQRMIPHHAQALEMTALVKDRAASADMTLLAERITVSQRDEIAQMERWLRERGEEVTKAHTSHEGHDTLMPGMLNQDQLNQLKAAQGVQFDRLFLEFMIHHHEGALTMVRELYAAGGGLEPATDRFAREVNADQAIEITRMRAALAKLNG